MTTALNEYTVGQVARLTGSYTQGGVAIDPTTVSVTIRRPDGVKQTYVYNTDAEVVRTGAGAYRLDYQTVVAGPHWYLWSSTGTGATAGELSFQVNPTHTSE